MFAYTWFYRVLILLALLYHARALYCEPNNCYELLEVSQ